MGFWKCVRCENVQEDNGTGKALSCISCGNDQFIKVVTRREINEFINGLSTVLGHRDRVKQFCKNYPKWNPIIEDNDEDICETII